MAKKSSKRKSGNGLSTGTTLGALALIISIGALGLGLYQFILPPASEKPQIYTISNDDIIFLNGIMFVEYLDPVSITYTAKVGDKVVLEFSCRIHINPLGTTTIGVYFDNNGTVPSSNIYLTTDSYFTSSCYMKYIFNSTKAGEYHLEVYATIDDQSTNSYIRNSILTVTVYG